MSLNRIQKLLFSEYCDFEDMVLVESPFAQTSREGKGLRQVHLGITPSKLIMATDVLPTAKDLSGVYLCGVDPDVETLELIAVYPLECVTISIFHRKRRQSLKARFSNNKVLYFELGGFEKRHMFWTLWSERVKLLAPDINGSSHSETSVATSTTNSTLYLRSSRKIASKHGAPQFWFEYGCKRTSSKWTDRNLFLEGNDCLTYVPKKSAEDFNFKSADFLGWENKMKKYSLALPEGLYNEGKTCKVCRFGSEIKENCQSSLFLPAENYLVQRKFSDSTTDSADLFTLYSAMPLQNSVTAMMLPEIAENCVKLWEFYRDATSTSMVNRRHKRRYGLSPKPHFLHGLGPWNVAPGERFSIQAKRALSLVNIRRQPLEPELRLPVSKRQLVASVSCEALNKEDKMVDNNAFKTSPSRPVIFFWTPEYWYRPRSPKDAYIETREHLTKIREYREENETKPKRRNIFRKRRTPKKYSKISDSDSSDQEKCKKKRFFNVFAKDDVHKRTKQVSSIQYLKRMLKMDMILTAWDFDSTTLAYQLTLIDRDLFLKIPPVELGILLFQQTSKNAPNVGALIAFSHRVSCLVVTEILRDDSEQIRARLVARFINTAEKCNRISNFQSCKSVLSGLQNPSVYRLQATWNYLRKKHATKYLIFEQLCRQYRDPRLKIYQMAFQHASEAVPYLPSIADLISRLLDHVPNYNDPKNASSTTNSFRQPSETSITEPTPKETTKNFLRTLFFWLKPPSLTDAGSVAADRRKREVRNPRMAGDAPKSGVMRPKSEVMDPKSQVMNTKSEVMDPKSEVMNTKCEVMDPKSEVMDPKSGVKNRKNGFSCPTNRRSLTDYYDSLNLIEDNRLERLRDTVELLQRFQVASSHYFINKNDLAREYLLKARYREERENFFHSLQVESVNCRNLCYRQ